MVDSPSRILCALRAIADCFSSPGSIVVALLALTIAGCRPDRPEPVAATLTGPTMGTRYEIDLAALAEGVTAAELQHRINAALESVNDQMSTWRPDSEISQFNESDATDWFPVSSATAKVVAEAQRISADSNGAFDVTVMPLVNLWSFGPEARPETIPSDVAIAGVKKRVGYQHLGVRQEPPALRKAIPHLQVDLSAIAKGFAVDVVADLLDDAGVSGYMVEIGGEVRTQGHKADGSAWRIGIEKPVSRRRALQKVLELNTIALATSGDYRNYFEEEGVRYSHTIDPRTGRPVQHALAAVSVLHTSCMTADALATTVMVLGGRDGYNWLASRDLAAVLYVKTAGGFRERRTPAFEARFGPVAPPTARRRSPSSNTTGTKISNEGTP